MKKLTVYSAAAATLQTITASSQFHLSLVDKQKYMLDWVTTSSINSSTLLFGTSADALSSSIDGKSAGQVTESAGKTVLCWSALLSDLEPGVTVFYALQSESEIMNFTVPNGEITWTVFGDMGAPVQGHAAAVSLPALKNALSVDGAYSGVLNIGDLSYELTGSNGQNYMEELEVITSQVPMMTTVGNHEYQYALSPAFAVQNYYRRFQGITLGAGAASGSSSNEFYSFSSGLIHFVFINTEVYGDETFAALQSDGVTWKVDEAARTAAGTAQAKWLEYDLSRVKRSETPYVVICGHRPPFKTPKGLSATGNRFAKEIVPLMSKYQVDLYLAGHEHTYLMFEKSTFNSYNIPPIIISGSSGNNEYIREEAELDIEDFTWKTLIPKYGYGYLTATKQALEWQWGSAASDATHEPSSAMWKKEDEVSFPRQKISAEYAALGSAVSEPVDVTGEWENTTTTSGSGAGAGSVGSSTSSAAQQIEGSSSSSAAMTLSAATFGLQFVVSAFTIVVVAVVV